MNLLIMLKIFDFCFKPAKKKLKHTTLFAGMNIAVSFSQSNEESKAGFTLSRYYF